MRSEANPEPLKAMWPVVRERLNGLAPAPRYRAAFAMATSAVAAFGVALGLYLGMWFGEPPAVVSDSAWSEISSTLTGSDAVSFSDIYFASVEEEGSP